MADELLDIADDATNDFMERNGKLLPNHAAINRSRLRVDIRKWLLSKALPKVKTDVGSWRELLPFDSSLEVLARHELP
jgi:hypothetical protein